MIASCNYFLLNNLGISESRRQFFVIRGSLFEPFRKGNMLARLFLHLLKTVDVTQLQSRS